MLVVYDYDGNSIPTDPKKQRSDSDTVRTYDKIHHNLDDHGFNPQLQIMDNLCSVGLQWSLKVLGIYLQLVPPHTHIHNSAERAIQTFKTHFIAGLCSTDKAFPFHL
jgi:hypothetical protein